MQTPRARKERAHEGARDRTPTRAPTAGRLSTRPRPTAPDTATHAWHAHASGMGGRAGSAAAPTRTTPPRAQRALVSRLRKERADDRPAPAAARRRRFRHDEYMAGDLFSGFGGLTQGIERAGFTAIVAANTTSTRSRSTRRTTRTSSTGSRTWSTRTPATTTPCASSRWSIGSPPASAASTTRAPTRRRPTSRVSRCST